MTNRNQQADGTRMSQLEIDKWAQDKPPVIAIFCQNMACLAEDLHEILSYAINQEHVPGFPEPVPKKWLRLYRNHRRLEQHLSRLEHFGEFPKFLVDCYETLQARKKSRFPHQKKQVATFSPEQQAEVDAALQKIYRLNLAEIASELKAVPLPNDWKKAVKAQLVNQEFLFLFKVVLPCIICYRTTPFQLIRQARLGNLKALEQLIRLDILVLADPRIILQAHRLLHRNKYKYESVIVRAMMDAPKFSSSPRSIKYLLAGAISLFSEALGYRLKAPRIRELFNSFTKDKTGDKYAIDRDLPDILETFSREIRTERKFLKSILYPDKTF